MYLTWLDEFSITPTPWGRVDIFAQVFSKTGPKEEIKNEKAFSVVDKHLDAGYQRLFVVF